jgi:CheY-like chemotaxis protein
VLEALERESYDVVLMDMHLRNMDGLTATREICERWSRERRPRIIAVSASELPEDRSQWQAAGADGWVSKSLPEEDLRRILAGSTGSRPGPARAPVAQRPPGRAGASQREPFEMGVHVMDIFLRDAAGQLAALREACAAVDAGTVERVAHTLKGNAAMLGATSVARSCAELIQSARNGALDGGIGVVGRIEQQIASIQQALAPRPAYHPTHATDADPDE